MLKPYIFTSFLGVQAAVCLVAAVFGTEQEARLLGEVAGLSLVGAVVMGFLEKIGT